MKIFSKIYFFIIALGLLVIPLLPFVIQLSIVIASLPLVIFIHLDNIKFYKKLDRVMAGDKTVKF